MPFPVRHRSGVVGVGVAVVAEVRAGAANAVFLMRGISPSGWIGQQAKGGGGFAAGKRAPRRCAPTKAVHIPLLKAARRGGYAGCGFAPRIELAFGDSLRSSNHNL